MEPSLEPESPPVNEGGIGGNANQSPGIQLQLTHSSSQKIPGGGGGAGGGAGGYDAGDGGVGARNDTGKRSRSHKRRGHDVSGKAGQHHRRTNKSRHQKPMDSIIQQHGQSEAKRSRSSLRSHRRSSLPANISFGLPNDTSRLSSMEQEKLEWIHQQTRHHRLIRERHRQSSVSDGSSIPHSITTRSSFSGGSHPMGGFTRHNSSDASVEVGSSRRRLSIGGDNQSMPLSSPIVVLSHDKEGRNSFTIRPNSHQDQDPMMDRVGSDDSSPQTNKPKVRHNIAMRRCSLDSSMMSYLPKRTSQSASRLPRSNSLDLSDNQREPIIDALLGGVMPRRRSQSEDKDSKCFFDSVDNQQFLDSNEGGEGGGGRAATDIAREGDDAEKRKERRKKHKHPDQASENDIAKIIEFVGPATEMGDSHHLEAIRKGKKAARQNTTLGATKSKAEEKIRSGDRTRDRRKSDSIVAKRSGRSAEDDVVPQIIRLSDESKSNQDFDMDDIELGDPILNGNNHGFGVVAFKVDSANIGARPRRDNPANKSKEKKKKPPSAGLFRVTPLVLGATCSCYLISLMLAGGLGFWLHTIADEEAAQLLSTPTLMPTYQNASNPDTAMESKFTPSVKLEPSSAPSLMPSTSSSPTSYPSIDITSTPSISFEPTLPPSDMPSFSPTTVPVCPDQLLNTVPLDDANMLTFKYELVMSNFYPGGGLLCASLEFAGTAGWIGVAFSTASRDPQFGVKEAVIGIPGILTTTAVARDGSATLGNQGNVVLDDALTYLNPAKYLIPAGGLDTEGYLGPIVKLLRNLEMQTLVNATVTFITDAFSDDSNSTDQSANDSIHRTLLTFAKHLQEPNEIKIEPHGSNLLLFAVAMVDDDGEYDGNPEWQSINLVLDGSSDV
ncbi:hypothetical protein ACHAWU_008315 [Discostella pseudostelligera]|uniref:DOMON domain-containing protein n=1 Tax=Discostella pseudostelligera TaxID=259834 RepID=A0ABD3M751_9STRA